jgi:hypothetical protein
MDNKCFFCDSKVFVKEVPMFETYKKIDGVVYWFFKIGNGKWYQEPTELSEVPYVNATSLIEQENT